MAAVHKKKAQRQPHQKKQPQKGKKSLRNRPELYSEVKTKSTFVLTPFAKYCLNELAKSAGVSMSESLERLLRQTADPSHSQAFAHTQLLITELSDPDAKSSG